MHRHTLDRGIEQSGIRDYCREHNIGILAYSPLANGLLTGKISPERKFGEGDLRRGNLRFSRSNLERVNAALEQFRPIADQHQATIAQLVIAWTAAQPGMTSILCGARNAQQAIDNARAVDLALTVEELSTVQQAVRVLGEKK